MDSLIKKFVERLKAGGVPEAQAKAKVEVLVAGFFEAMDSQLASKSDINRLEPELLVVKWIFGLVLGGIVTIVLNDFSLFNYLLIGKPFLQALLHEYLFMQSLAAKLRP